MKNTILSIVAVFSLTSTAFAEDTATQDPTGPALSGKVSMDFTQDTTTDKWGGAMGLELDIDAGSLATVDLDFKGADGSALDLDTWAVGTTVAGVGLAFGDDLGVMPGAEGEQTLAAPVMAEALAVSVGDASVAIGLTDWTTDVTDISNIQGAYTIDMDRFAVTAAADYNLDSENTVIGAGIAGIDLGVAALGGAMTYDTDASSVGYEGVVTVGGLTAYLNGDDTDTLQNVGGEYTYNVAGAELNAGAVYNVDSEELTPSAGISFSF